MKLVILITFCAVSCANAVPLKGGSKYSIVSQNDEIYNVRHVNFEEIVQINSLDPVRSAHFLMEYYLYTRSNPTMAQRLYMHNEELIRVSFFNPSNPTVVIAHGFLGNHNSELNPTIRDAFLAKSDVNVIVLNWQRIGGDSEELATLDTPALGGVLGQFLRYLSEVSGAGYSNMHLIGFSLGAHLVANAGKELNGQIARITGLDPAGSIWQYHPNRMGASDAIYVEGIHTSKEFGIQSSVGDVDFYPNGGETQPGCLTPICSHNRAWRLFAATVTYNHLEGRRCESITKMMNNLCFDGALKMGNDDINKQGSGIYRLTTRRLYPF